MPERDRDHAIGAAGERHGGGELKEALGAHEVGLKRWAERVATPGRARDADAGFRK